MSFSALSGRILTTFRAGLALKTVSSLVKGLMPLRALVAGFLMTLIFIRPGTVKRPGPRPPTFFLICLLSESKTAWTCFLVSSVSSAMRVSSSDLVGGFTAAAVVEAFLAMRKLLGGGCNARCFQHETRRQKRG